MTHRDALVRLHARLNRQVRQAEAAGHALRAHALRRRMFVVSGLLGQLKHADNALVAEQRRRAGEPERWQGEGE